MKINAVSASRLTPEHVAAWSRMQRADAAVDSPFFRPEFVQTLAAFHDDVEVAVLEEDGKQVGFFPFQRIRGNVGVPVGGNVCDFHGAVLGKGIVFDAERLVRDCGLAAWHFDNVVASQEPFVPYHWARFDAPYMDLSDGFEAYRIALRKAGSKEIRRAMQKLRKVEREVGRVRFEPHTADRHVLETLILWRTQRYRQDKAINYLSPRWKVALLERLLDSRNEALRGMLSAVYFGDRLAAAHFGLRSYGVLHGWFPAYDPAFSRYSPGQILWVQLAQAAESQGVLRIDLGRGQERYKLGLMSGASCTAEGSVDFRRVRGYIRRRWIHTRWWVRSSPLRAPARFVARSTRACFGLHK